MPALITEWFEHPQGSLGTVYTPKDVTRTQFRAMTLEYASPNI
jgi:hypothetical protein